MPTVRHRPAAVLEGLPAESARASRSRSARRHAPGHDRRRRQGHRECARSRRSTTSRRKLGDAKITIDGIERKDTRIHGAPGSSDARTQFTDLVKEHFPNLAIEDSSTTRARSPRSSWRSPSAKSSACANLALDQSLETIRNRIDQFGVTEPIIQREGDAGHRDPAARHPGPAARQGSDRPDGGAGVQAAVGDCQIRGRSGGQEAAAAGNADSATAPRPSASAGARSGSKYLVRVEDADDRRRHRRRAGAAGNADGGALRRARAQRARRQAVRRAHRRATSAGAWPSSSTTTVYSAPVIRERIGGGRASITGNFDIKEARDLAIVLRAGALPAPVHVAEERTVGPSLGQDSIRQGIIVVRRRRLVGRSSSCWSTTSSPACSPTWR